MQQVTLNNGVVMPILGYGVFQIPDPQECERIELSPHLATAQLPYFYPHAVYLAAPAGKSNCLARR